MRRDGDVRDWVACLVRPVTEHLAAMGNPTWFARFGAQVMTGPALHEIMIDEARISPSLVRILDGLNRCLPDLPLPVRAERKHMTSTLMMHTCRPRTGTGRGPHHAPGRLARRGDRPDRRDRRNMDGARDT
ncbi:hypothetical protein AB0L53_36705 [Nonomuraea sp. NPDC052129]|uniref:hypothetical protein n=1 Tax=Nonomuraea sp. NPDC052129 TaxID=3154651 RepID=UPI00341C6AEE